MLHYCISLFCAGVEVLNNAIETLHSSVSVEKWIYVNVTVAPSSITISNHDVGSYSMKRLCLSVYHKHCLCGLLF